MDVANLVSRRKVKIARMSRGWSQKDLAEAADVTAATISNLERGSGHEPQARTIYRIANALEVDVRELLEEEAAPLGEAPRSGSNVQGGRTQRRTASSHMGRITSRSTAVTVSVDQEMLREALRAVEEGHITAGAAEEMLLAGAGA